MSPLYLLVECLTGASSSSSTVRSIARDDFYFFCSHLFFGQAQTNEGGYCTLPCRSVQAILCIEFHFSVSHVYSKLYMYTYTLYIYFGLMHFIVCIICVRCLKCSITVVAGVSNPSSGSQLRFLQLGTPFDG